MENFDFGALTAAIGSAAAIIVTVTQFLKVQFGLKGRAVIVVSLLVGVGYGAAALQITGGALLPTLPPLAGGVLLGLLAGIVASGGKDLVTGIQKNGAKARVEAQVNALPPGEGSAAALPEPLRPATIEDVLRITGQWPAVPGLDDVRTRP